MPPRYLYGNYNEFDATKDQVLYSTPYWDEREVNAAINSLTNGSWLSSGSDVHKFEVAFSKKFNNLHSLMVNSGSSANLLMLATAKKLFGWKDSSEILVSAVSFPTTVAPIIQNGLKPIFLDIKWHDLNIDLSKIYSKCNNNTRAIIFAPVLGNPGNFDDLLKIQEELQLTLLLDNCDSLGSKYNGKFLNEYSTVSTTSLYASHHLCTGEGGLISSNSEEFIQTARSFAWWGRSCFCVGKANMLSCGTCGVRFSKWIDDYDVILDHKYLFQNIGYNLKPLELQGSIGLVQLEKFNEIHTKRINNSYKIRHYISKYLWPLGIRTIWPYNEESNISWFGVPLICDKKKTKQSLQEYLEANRIQTRNYFAGNILRQPGYQHLDNYAKYPVADEVLNRVLFIGCNPSYTTKVLDYIEKVLKEFKL